MTIQTSTEIFETLAPLPGVAYRMDGKWKDAALAAIVQPSPVVRVDEAAEALYAAVMQDTALTGDTLLAVATLAGQLAYLLTYYQWHGKTQRGADITAAMNAVVAGTAPSALSNPPAVAETFAPPPPAPVAPPSA
jgi:hypothetical protein